MEITEEDWKVVEARLEKDIEMEEAGIIPKSVLMIIADKTEPSEVQKR